MSKPWIADALVIISPNGNVTATASTSAEAQATVDILNDVTKSERMKEFQNAVSSQIFGKSRSACIATATCMGCKRKIDDNKSFESMEDLREYGISALCPTCFEKIARG